MESTSTLFPLPELSQNDLMQSVVHDLRTPITVVKSYLRLLINGELGAMPADQMAMLQRSVGPLEDMIHLTDNLLQSLTLQSADAELRFLTVDVDAFLGEIVEFYRFTFQQRGIRIELRGAAGVQARIDPFWFKRALHNLVWNAYKFTPDNGRITLEVRPGAEGLEVSVEDTGRGIPAAKIGQIFEKFSQASPEKDRRNGSGLGLWICRRVMDLHGGRIFVHSTEGVGSRFTLQLPADKVL